MSTDQRLEDKLKKLASESSTIVDGWRRIGGVYPDDPLSAVVAEIDETVLPSRLDFRNAAGDVLGIYAGNRRLGSIPGPLPEALAGFKELCGADLAEPTADLLQKILELFSTHAGDSPELWVQSAEADESAAASGGGLLAKTLARAWRLDAWGSSGKDRTEEFEKFLRELQQHSNYWLKIAGDEVVERSSDDTPLEFDDFDAGSLNALILAPNEGSILEDPLFVVLGARSTNCLVAARYGETTVVAKLARRGGDLAAERWRAGGL